MAADEPASDDGGKSELVHCGAFFFLSWCVVFDVVDAREGL